MEGESENNTRVDKIIVKKNNSAKFNELEAKIAELTAGWQRTQADFLNYKKQASDERVNLVSSANSDLIYQILPVLDNFKLAADHMPAELTEDTWAQGIKQVERQLESILQNEGLERIETIGKQFDPNLHEAIEHIESDKPEDEVISEVLPGYIYNSHVLRPAKVKVSKPKS